MLTLLPQPCHAQKQTRLREDYQRRHQGAAGSLLARDIIDLVHRPRYFPWDGRGEKRRGKKRSVRQSGLHRRVGGAWVNPNRTKNKIYVCVWGGGLGSGIGRGSGREENSRREHLEMGCREGVGLAVIRQRRVAGRKNDVPAVPNRRIRVRNVTSLTLVSQPLRTSHFSQARRQIYVKVRAQDQILPISRKSTLGAQFSPPPL